MRRTILAVLVLGMAALARTQPGDVVIHERVFNDDSDSTVYTLKDLPNVTLADFKVDGDGIAPEFANRHTWFISSDGVNDHQISINTAWSLDFDLVLFGDPIAPRKEAGFLIKIGMPWGFSEGQFIVNTDAHEVVAFGYPFPFYSFNANHGLSFDSGDTIHLGVNFFKDPADDLYKIIYRANAFSSPALVLADQHLFTGWTSPGGYLQVSIDRGHPTNHGVAVFRNIEFVPEPGSLIALGTGLAGLLLRRRARK